MYAAEFSTDLNDGSASSWWFELSVSHYELDDLEYDAMLDSERAASYSPIDPEANHYSAKNAAELQAFYGRAIHSVGRPTANDFVREVRITAETAFAGELRKCALDARLARKAKLNARRSQLAAQHGVAPHRLAPTPTIELDGWHEDAARATGEEQDRAPDAAEWWLRSDAKFVDVAVEDRRDPIDALQARVYMEWKNALLPSERKTWDAKENWELARSSALDRYEEQDVVPRLTQDQLGRDLDDLAYMHRDEARPAKGYGMTTKETRRKWLQDALHRYLDIVTEAMQKNRVDQAHAQRFPAVKSVSNHARAVVAKWEFQDELERHEAKYHSPESDTLRILKEALSGTEERPHGNYADAVKVLVGRRHKAERGRLDRFVA